MIYIFYSGISARGMDFNYHITRDIQYNPDAILSSLPNAFMPLLLTTFSYFGFGFFYTSRFVMDLWFSSIDYAIAGFIPFGAKAVGMSLVTTYMKETIDMGARWHPDVAVIIYNYGFIGLLAFGYILGAFSKNIYEYINDKSSAIVFVSGYCILLEMIALPVGNFILVSSSNKLIVLLLILIWVWKFMRIPKIKLT